MKDKYLTVGEDYRFMQIKNIRGTTNHVVYYDYINEVHLPICGYLTLSDYKRFEEDGRYTLSKEEPADGRLCKVCTNLLVENDLASVNIDFEKHLIKKSRRIFAERGLTVEEYKDKGGTDL